MRPVTVTVTSVTTSAVIPLDHFQPPSTVAIGVKLGSGVAATYKVEHTFDDVFAAGFSPASATWFDHPVLVAKTANADGNYAYPPTAIRLNVSAYTGSNGVTMVVNTAGVQ